MAELKRPANTEGNNETQGNFSALPVEENGERIQYLAHITASKWKPTKAKTGELIEMQVRILEGEYKGRMLFERLNLVNPNPVAVDIANRTLNSICAACDLEDVEDTDDLHNIPMVITLTLNEATAQFAASNSIGSYTNPDKIEGPLPWE